MKSASSRVDAAASGRKVLGEPTSGARGVFTASLDPVGEVEFDGVTLAARSSAPISPGELIVGIEVHDDAETVRAD